MTATRTNDPARDARHLNASMAGNLARILEDRTWLPFRKIRTGYIAKGERTVIAIRSASDGTVKEVEVRTDEAKPRFRTRRAIEGSAEHLADACFDAYIELAGSGA